MTTATPHSYGPAVAGAAPSTSPAAGGGPGSAPRLLLLDGGGTISETPADPHAGQQAGVGPFHWLLGEEKEILESEAILDYAWAEGCRGDSSARRPTDWVRLATQIDRLRDVYDGFVVAHGTATLAYGASMLSFFLLDMGKPIVFTGAQTPVRNLVGAAASDGLANLISSVRVARDGQLREVVVVFGASVLRGNRSHKEWAFDRDAFVSPNHRALGYVDALGVAYDPSVAQAVRSWGGLPPVRLACDERVQVIAVNPCLTAGGIALDERARAVVVSGYVSGIVPAPVRDQLVEIARDLLVVIHGAGSLGQTNPRLRLRATVPFIPPNAAWAADMTPEAALMKTCWVLGQADDRDTQRLLLEHSIAGELTE